MTPAAFRPPEKRLLSVGFCMFRALLYLEEFAHRKGVAKRVPAKRDIKVLGVRATRAKNHKSFLLSQAQLELVRPSDGRMLVATLVACGTVLVLVVAGSVAYLVRRASLRSKGEVARSRAAGHRAKPRLS
ncbi:hypothetical protein MRX96_029110, partial [Rhipicephalus microplus]